MQLLKYPREQNKIENYLSGRVLDFRPELNRKVSKIIAEVKEKGDEALKDFTKRFDGVNLTSLQMEREDLSDCNIDSELEFSLKNAYRRIKNYYQSQSKTGWTHYQLSGQVGEKVIPLDRAGLYIPGGKAAYPSSVLMTAIPASVAGVKELVAVTPPDKNGNINPVTAYALSLCGVDEVYKIGGAQAIAALALGTETIAKVDKIVGPGNKYVTMAKKLVYGRVDIDMLAGPSEIMIIADKTADPRFLAADLLAQSEHDEEARSIIVSPCEDLFIQVKKHLKVQLEELSTAGRAREALDNHGLFLEVDNLSAAVEAVNEFAPEHLEILTDCPHDLSKNIRHAGSIFLGRWSPEAAGDYIAGPNHVLPTSGTAKFFSSLSVSDFVKSSGMMFFNRDELGELGQDIMRIAEAENLPAHARSISIRLENEKGGNHQND